MDFEGGPMIFNEFFEMRSDLMGVGASEFYLLFVNITQNKVSILHHDSGCTSPK